MTRVAIVHFSPIELYPPLLNLVRTVENEVNITNHDINILTTSQSLNTPHIFTPHSSNIKITRLSKSGSQLRSISRYWNYLKFFVKSLFILIKQQPQNILYYETSSSAPVFFYKRFVNKSCSVMIHYHEYTAPIEYIGISKYLHRLEMYLYPRSSWVSHTNRFRMNFFIKDIAPIRLPNPQIVKNYPPKFWQRKPNEFINSPLKIVYVGALGLSSMYVSEFANWVVDQKGKVIWDIYALVYSKEVESFFNSLNSEYIKLNPSVDYFNLPSILKNYDVGIILYKGIIVNQVYLEPNKLFEYLTIGLDVWFPIELIGSLGFVSNDYSPKVIPIDFNKLEEANLTEIILKKEKIIMHNFACENELSALLSQLFSY